MSCRATQDGWAIVKSYDKIWSARGGNGKPLHYSCYEKNPMKNMKRQKDMTLEDKTPGGKVFSMPLGKSRGQSLVAPER